MQIKLKKIRDSARLPDNNVLYSDYDGLIEQTLDPFVPYTCGTGLVILDREKYVVKVDNLASGIWAGVACLGHVFDAETDELKVVLINLNKKNNIKLVAEQAVGSIHVFEREPNQFVEG